MDLMNLTARDLSNKWLEAFQICLTFPCPDPGLSNQQASHDERFEYRLADFNLWIDGIGALAPSKASLDARLSERSIDLSLVKGNLVMLFQSLEDCLDLLEDNGSLEEVLLDIDSALESLVTLSLAIRRTGRRSRLHKADRLFKPEEHTELRKHLEAIIVLRPGSGPVPQDDELRPSMESLTPLQSHLVTANLKRRNRFIQAQLHSLGLKKRSVGFEFTLPEAPVNDATLAPSPEDSMGEITMLASTPPAQTPNRPLSAPMSVTSASVPETPDVYYSSRSMLEQHFRQDHPPVWVCPLCDHGSVYSSMTEIMDHLHDTHAKDVGEDISSIISSSAQKRMGIESCPLCEVKGDIDSPELIDHVLEHVHDFSLRSLPWPRPSEVDISGEVGSFNPESGEAVAIAHWLEGYEHETEDIDPSPKLSTCDYGRLMIITEQLKSQKEDKTGLDIGFADEHGDESAEAETDISQLTQDTLEPLGLIKESERDLDVVICHECSAEWLRDEDGLVCPQCQSDVVEIIGPVTDPRDQSLNKTPTEPPILVGSLDKIQERQEAEWVLASASKSSTRESTSGFRRLTDRLFSRKNLDDIDPLPYLDFNQKPVANQKAWDILTSIYHRRLHSPTKTQSMFENFIRDVQNQECLPTLHPVSDLRSFLQVMLKLYLDPLAQLPPKDLTKAISNYFINSSHRTPSNTILKSQNTYNAIHEVLYFGYRFIELDVWNGTANTEELEIETNQSRDAMLGKTTKTLERLLGINRAPNAQKPVAPKITISPPIEPIVKDGFTFMKPCGFREACQGIRDSAFINTDLPVIINLEVHADSEQQKVMAKIMKEEWGDILVDKPLEGYDPRYRLPTLEDLRGRILIRFGAITNPYAPNSGQSVKDLYGESHPRRIPIIQPITQRIIQPLVKLGVYLRQEKIEGFTDVQTSSASHLLSMQEREAQELISTSPTKLFRHNQDHFCCVYPSPVRLDSSNLDPLKFWRYGIQMAAINRQHIDEGMMLNEGMFANESGWVLKPNGYRSSNEDFPANPEDAPRKGLELNIFAFKDQKFATSTGREIKNLASFMIVSLHVNDEEKPRTPRQELNTTENESGALGYNLNFFITRAEPTIIPKLCILR
ncbi:1-phosphatidylinositol-4,5-bisphosphate phosphodiesterase [Fusarium circinatum]|uniref:Phosphoinositide phospholipase C n=1 Tax=Fusarium circinatum TaxID=48490 RepID=A0A8H5X1Z8_FUSCI|nr:1-phosphatidylinositol-4,5-bisphosphate phosphodiesterase [Fusarium circinatum]